VAEDVIRVRRIELVDDQGDPSIVLEGSRSGALIVASPEDAPVAWVGEDRQSGRPYLVLGLSKEGGKITVGFDNNGRASAWMRSEGGTKIMLGFDDDGRAIVRARNEDGTEGIITPP
jgi:hypothetical protein